MHFKPGFVLLFGCLGFALLPCPTKGAASSNEVYLDGHSAVTLNSPMTLFQRSRTTMAFRTCQGGGRLIQQRWAGSQEVTIEVLDNGAIQMSWRVRGRQETVHIGLDVLDNRWHEVDLHRRLGTLTLRVDNSSLLLASTNSLRPYLIQEALQHNPSKAVELNTVVGDEFTGCILEGAGVELGQVVKVAGDVKLGIKCSSQFIESDTCLGYGIDPCFSFICENGGTCRAAGDAAECICPKRYTGARCETVQGPLCKADSCLNQGTCHESPDGSSTYCACKAGFFGEKCEKPAAPSLHCASAPCANGGRCHASDDGESYECTCQHGFTGQNCETKVNSCGSNPCRNNATCVEAPLGYTCQCREGYRGINCEINRNECTEDYSPCNNRGRCFDRYGGFQCVCQDQFEGDRCERALDHCSSRPCQNGGTCKGVISGYQCECPPGFQGNNCEISSNDCSRKPAGKQCSDPHAACDARTGSCKCKPGYVATVDSQCLPARSCSDEPCLNGGRCSGNGFAYQCACAENFAGRHCEYQKQVNRDRCDDSTCANGGSCVPGTSDCACVPGFVGARCETNVDNCAKNICENHGRCVDLVDDFICSCAPGFMGKTCNVSMVPVIFHRGDPCAFHNCGPNGRCVEVEGEANCECNPGFFGEHCDLGKESLISCNCKNSGTCNNQGECICPEGYHGALCEHQTDACDEAPCFNGANCTAKGLKDFVCSCPQGYTGKMCEINIDDCANVTCPGNQKCYDRLNGYECRCPEGFRGEACDQEINGCDPNPCHEGATCENRLGRPVCHCPQGRAGENCTEVVSKCFAGLCLNGAVCQDTDESYQCFCRPGFTGEHCEIDFNECLSAPCQNGATCKDMVNRFACQCAPGFTGRVCETDINECALNPCKNGATCNDRVAHYTCSCLPGYTGTDCETDIDECASSPCANGQCIDFVNDYRCNCTDTGFKGSQCEINIDDCAELPCQNGATCEDGVKEFRCLCNPGFVGKTCETDIPECESSPCLNGATCLERSNRSLYAHNYLNLFPSYNESDAAGYICVCPVGFTGANCEVNIDDCVNHQCRNGTCVDEINSYRCECHQGFEGEFCELEINECERYSPCAHGACVDLVGDYSCNCQRGYGDKNCSTALIGCERHECSSHSKCDPFLDADGQHQYRCLCESGFVGRHCEIGTTVSFQKWNSAWELQYTKREDFSMSLYFRTSLRSVRVAGINALLGSDTFVSIQKGVLVVTQNYKDVLHLGEGLNDAEWHNFTLAVSAQGRVEVFIGHLHGEVEGTLKGANVTNVILGFSDVAASGQTDGFLGCMQEIRVNDELMIPSRQKEHLHETSDVCVRTPQCTRNPCQNGGECHDEWFSRSCLCQRPFYGQLCEKFYPSATFGFMKNLSWVKVLVEPEQAESISRTTDISLFALTRSPSGLLFYMGTDPAQQPQDSYLAAVLDQGHLKVILKLDTAVYQLAVDSPRIDDGNLHFVQVERSQSSLRVTVDKTNRSLPLNGGILRVSELHLGWMNTHKSETQKSPSVAQVKPISILKQVATPVVTTLAPVQIKIPTEAPVLPRIAVPAAPTPGVATIRRKRQVEGVTDPSGNTPNFKGILQDVRVGNQHVPFTLQNVEGFRFGKASERQNVIEGKMGDPVCDSNPCHNGAACVDTFNAFECVCTSDFRGPLCEELKPCRKFTCPGTSKCQDLVDGYECVVNASFEGKTTLEYKAVLDDSTRQGIRSIDLRVILESAADLLQLSSAGQVLRVGVGADGKINLNANGQKIQVGDKAVTDGVWHDVKIDSLEANKLKISIDGNDTTVALNSTLNIGSSLDEIRLGERLKGALGEVRIGNVLLPFFEDSQLINSSTRNKFVMVGSARPTLGLVLCWEGDCDNGGKCSDPSSSFRCECKEGWQGLNCQENVDECVAMPEPCLNQGSCRDTVGSYQCVCAEGFEGLRCEQRILYCRSSPCLNGGTCEDTTPGNYTCHCTPEWDGASCQDRRIIDCFSSPCFNNGTCSNKTPSDKTPIAYDCTCLPGFEGRDCEVPKNFCKAQPCQNGGRCQSVNREATFRCNCPKGYGGHICDHEIDYCALDGCENGGTCTKHIGGRTCNCSGTGFKGERCDQDVDECLFQKCLNGGSCNNLRGSFECLCSPEFFGPMCSFNNTCFEQNPCENGGSCLPFEANELKFVCSCLDGFTGQRCEDRRTALSSSDIRLIVGLSAACIVLLCFIVAVGLFLRVAKRKRATRGTYSPSRQEIYGSRVEMAHVIKPPPEERLI